MRHLLAACILFACFLATGCVLRAGNPVLSGSDDVPESLGPELRAELDRYRMGGDSQTSGTLVARGNSVVSAVTKVRPGLFMVSDDHLIPLPFPIGPARETRWNAAAGEHPYRAVKEWRDFFWYNRQRWAFDRGGELDARSSYNMWIHPWFFRKVRTFDRGAWMRNSSSTRLLAGILWYFRHESDDRSEARETKIDSGLGILLHTRSFENGKPEDRRRRVRLGLGILWNTRENAEEVAHGPLWGFVGWTYLKEEATIRPRFFWTTLF